MRATRFAVSVGFVAAVIAAIFVSPAAASVTPSFSATNVTSCNDSSTVTVTVNAQNPTPLEAAADIVLLVDRSGSIGATAFQQVKDSVDAFITSSAPSAAGNHIGIVGFSTGATPLTGGLLTDPTQLHNVATNMIYTQGSTYTLDGMRAAETMLTGPGSRSGAPKVIIVETDGVWNPAPEQDPTAFAYSLVTGGTLIFAIGVGSGVNHGQLVAIAGGTAANVLNVSDYDGLSGALDSALTTVIPAATGLAYAATPTSEWTITGASATAGTTSFTPSGVAWSLDQINSATPTTVTITYTEQHVGSTDGSRPLASSALLTWSDDGGAAQQTDYSSRTADVNGCNRPPTAAIAPVGQQVLNGSRTATVHLDASGSSDPDGDSLTYAWTFDSATNVTGADTATPAADFGLGPHTAHVVVSDGRLTAVADVAFDVVDLTPPTVTANVAGTVGSNGWYTSNADVSFTIADAESDVTSQSGDCAGATVGTDTTGVTFSCIATSAGGPSAPASVIVKRDATAPTITYAGNAVTYHLGDTVSITCTAFDATSGLASPAACPGASGPAYTFAGGVNTLSTTAMDNAGNTSTQSTTFTVVVDAAGLCGLIRQWADNAGVANSLCIKIDKGHMQPFWNELAAQRGKHVPAAKADIILALSRGL